MIKKIAYTLFLTWPTALLTNEPKDWQLGFQKSASKSMDDIVWFHDYMLVPIITAITAFVLFLLLYVCVRYRASKNQIPSTTSHNTLIEVIWTIVPCLILIVMAVPSFKVLYSQDEIPKADVTIKAIGYQWYWGYEYPDENIIFDSYMIDEKDLKENQPRLLAVDNAVYVPVNKVVKVMITANDVLHAWALPSFGVKRDAIPGRINETWFKADRTGTFYGQCSELCGIKHAFMPVVVRAVEQEEYDAWVAEKIALAEEEKLLTEKVWTTQELIERGEGVYLKNCVACHQQNGQGLPPVFPSLVGSQIVMNEKARNIEILMEGVQGAAMQSFSKQLSEVDMAAVITYTRQSWGNEKNGDGEIVVPKDIVEYKNRVEL